MRAEGDGADLIWMDAEDAAQALPTVFRKALLAGLTSLRLSDATPPTAHPGEGGERATGSIKRVRAV